MFGKRIGKNSRKGGWGIKWGKLHNQFVVTEKRYIRNACILLLPAIARPVIILKNYPNQEEFYVSRLGYKGYLNCNHTSYIQAGFIQKKVEDVYYYSSIILTDKSQGTDNNCLWRTVIYMQWRFHSKLRNSVTTPFKGVWNYYQLCTFPNPDYSENSLVEFKIIHSIDY